LSVNNVYLIVSHNSLAYHTAFPLQCFDTVGWATGQESSSDLKKHQFPTVQFLKTDLPGVISKNSQLIKNK